MGVIQLRLLTVPIDRAFQSERRGCPWDRAGSLRSKLPAVQVAQVDGALANPVDDFAAADPKQATSHPTGSPPSDAVAIHGWRHLLQVIVQVFALPMLRRYIC